MKNERQTRAFQIGPGVASLIMIVVVLSMCALGILALYNARSDLQLSTRAAAVTQTAYQLKERAEESLAGLDSALAALPEGASEEDMSAVLPDGMTLSGSTVSWREKADDGRTLYCAVEIAPNGETPRYRWTLRRLSSESNELSFVAQGLQDRAEGTLTALERLLDTIAPGCADDAAYQAAVQEKLTGAMEYDSGEIRWTEDTGEGMLLHCTVKLNPLGSSERCTWVDRVLEETEEGGNDEIWN